MKKYVSLSIAHFETRPALNYADFYIHTYGTNYKFHKRMSYKEGMKVLRRIERRLGKPAALIANEYGTTICYKVINAFY